MFGLKKKNSEEDGAVTSKGGGRVKRFVAVGLSAAIVFGLGAVSVDVFNRITPRADSEEVADIEKIISSLKLSDNMNTNIYQITSPTGDNIDDKIIAAYKSNVSAGSSDNDVVNRDWTIYDDEYGYKLMTKDEQEYYKRLENESVKYLTKNTMDACYVDTYDMYCSGGIPYSDLGLTYDEAVDVALWFVYNNPQYYFYKASFLASTKSLYIEIYDNMAKGSDRAAITNNLFDTVDDWIESVNDDEVTPYQKILSANNLLCDKIEYVDNEYDQSLYSAVILNKTVCTGYSKAMSLIMNASDVPATVVVSNTHAWDVVDFGDGKYYGVDVTWNDSLHGNRLLGVSATDIRKYDSSKESHVAIKPWTEWAPVCASDSYKPDSKDLNKEEKIVPSAPSNFKVSYSGSTATITWDVAQNATGYEIKLGTSVKALFSPRVRITNIKDDTVYSVYIRSANSSSSTYSDWSKYSFKKSASNTELSESSDTDDVVSKAEVLSKPEGFNVSYSGTTAMITWKSVTNATNYEVRRNDDSVKSISSAKMNVTNVTSGKTYYFYVRAVDSKNNIHSEWAKCSFTVPTVQNEQSVKTLAAPSNFTVKYSFKTATVSWGKVVNATGYEVKFDNSAVEKHLFPKVNINKVSSGTKYTIYVRAINSKDDTASEWVEYSFTAE